MTDTTAPRRTLDTLRVDGIQHLCDALNAPGRPPDFSELKTWLPAAAPATLWYRDIYLAAYLVTAEDDTVNLDGLVAALVEVTATRRPTPKTLLPLARECLRDHNVSAGIQRTEGVLPDLDRTVDTRPAPRVCRPDERPIGWLMAELVRALASPALAAAICPILTDMGDWPTQAADEWYRRTQKHPICAPAERVNIHLRPIRRVIVGGAECRPLTEAVWGIGSSAAATRRYHREDMPLGVGLAAMAAGGVTPGPIPLKWLLGRISRAAIDRAAQELARAAAGPDPAEELARIDM